MIRCGNETGPRFISQSTGRHGSADRDDQAREPGYQRERTGGRGGVMQLAGVATDVPNQREAEEPNEGIHERNNGEGRP